MNGIELDCETVDRITLIGLKEQRKYLTKELKRHAKGEYLHPEDVVGNQALIAHMDALIKYYGG